MSIKRTKKEKLNILFSALIIRTDSIEKNFGSVEEFAGRYDLYGIANHNILAMFEMMSPPGSLFEFAEKELEPNGLKEEEDFTFIEEELFYGVERPGIVYKNRKPLWTRRVRWLDGLVTKKGNFIWFKQQQPESIPKIEINTNL
jgi:hypothetical protein